MKPEKKLTRWERKKRSFIRRILGNFVNNSNSYIQQAMPSFISADNIQFLALRNYWIFDNKKNNDSDLNRLLFIIANVRELIESKVPGAFAELGVFKGNSAKVLHTLDPERKLYLFDTFEGFNKNDFATEIKQGMKEGDYHGDLASVKTFMGSSPNINYCVGYFPDTTNLVSKSETFALVHLDADLYEPTRAGMEYFYPKLNDGGLLILHDYLNDAWPGVKKAVDDFLRDKPESIINIPDRSGTAVLKKCKNSV